MQNTPVTASAESPATMVWFHDPRCGGDGVCPNESLFFTCTTTSPTMGLFLPPSSVRITVQPDTTFSAVLPDGYNAITIEYTSGLFNVTLRINKASLLGGHNITCDGGFNTAGVAAGCVIVGEFHHTHTPTSHEDI